MILLLILAIVAVILIAGILGICVANYEWDRIQRQVFEDDNDDPHIENYE